MDPSRRRPDLRLARLPRVCGDGPRSAGSKVTDTAAAPRMRGWTLPIAMRSFRLSGCPAYAGMDPRRPARKRCGAWLPRVCGDGPWTEEQEGLFKAAAPRMRGWTRACRRRGIGLHGCPAYAGMDPSRRRCCKGTARLPRVCGDGPTWAAITYAPAAAAPRMRGWTPRGDRRGRGGPGCPAYAGMDPAVTWSSAASIRLPADFSDRGRPFRADRGRRFSVIVDGHGRREATWSS